MSAPYDYDMLQELKKITASLSIIAGWCVSQQPKEAASAVPAADDTAGRQCPCPAGDADCAGCDTVAAADRCICGRRTTTFFNTRYCSQLVGNRDGCGDAVEQCRCAPVWR